MSQIYIKNQNNVELWNRFEWILSYEHRRAASKGSFISPTISAEKCSLRIEISKSFKADGRQISIMFCGLHFNQIKTICTLRFMENENCVWSSSRSGIFKFNTFHVMGDITRSELQSFDQLFDYSSIRLEGEYKVYDETDYEWNDYLFELDKKKDDFVELSKHNSALLDKKILSDFCIQVGDVKFQVHKAILAARSSVFASMFMQNMKENQENIMQITDFKPNIVEKFINYIYKGYTEKLEKDALNLFKIADKYDLTGLKTKCEKVLCDTISVYNSVNILNFAELYNAKKLQLTARSFIKEHIKEIIDTPDFLESANSNSTAMKILTCFKD